MITITVICCLTHQDTLATFMFPFYEMPTINIYKKSNENISKSISSSSCSITAVKPATTAETSLFKISPGLD